MILLAWNTGIRLNDAANLTWAHVDLQGDTLRFPGRQDRRTQAGEGEGDGRLPAPGFTRLARLTSRRGPARRSALPDPARQADREPRGTLQRLLPAHGPSARIRQPSTGAAGRTGKGRTFRALGFHSFRHAFISRGWRTPTCPPT